MTKRTRAAVFAATLALIPALAFAQKGGSGDQFSKGSMALSVGFLAGEQNAGGVGVGGSFEVGIVQAIPHLSIGIGGMIGYINYSGYSCGFGDCGSETIIPVAVIANAHYQIESVPKLDVYAGPTVGIAHWSFSCDGCGGFRTSHSESMVGVHAGASWNFAPRVSANAQVAAGTWLPTLQIGVLFKL